VSTGTTPEVEDPLTLFDTEPVEVDGQHEWLDSIASAYHCAVAVAVAAQV
jgi:hypothetical protein